MDDFLWGMPRSRPETCLIWKRGGGSKFRRRTALSTLSMTPHRVPVHFPSWSWMGWIGPINTSLERTISIFDVPEVLCYSHTTNSLTISRVRSIGEPQEASRQIDAYLFDPKRPYSEDDATNVWRPMDQPLSVSLQDLETHHPQLAAHFNSTPDSLLLFFWSSTVILNIYGTQAVNDRDKVVGRTEWQEDPFDVKAGSGLDPSVYPPRSIKDGFQMRRAEFVVLGHWQWKHVPYKMKTIHIRWDDGIAYKVNNAEIEER